MRVPKVGLLVFFLITAISTCADNKPKLTLDEFFNSVSFSSLELSPDGGSIVIGTERADWDRKIFSKDLWLYRGNRTGTPLVQLTQSGRDTSPKWSPDGRWIAFLSDRKTQADTADADDSGSGSEKSDKDEGVDQIYLIDPNGGEAFAITRDEEEVH